MKNKILSMAIMLSIIVFISSCSKDEKMQPIDNANNNKMVSARISTEMTDEEYEADIKAFIDKLENPSSYGEMNFEEAFEYVESTLIYEYINLDYSKCATISEFNSSLTISVDNEGEMSMIDIKSAYEKMRLNWSSNFHSINDENKTPIMFHITEITSTTIKYQMIIGHGYVDLDLWGENYIVPPSVNYVTAANSITMGMLLHLKNIGITNRPGLNYHLVFQNPTPNKVIITDPTLYQSINDPLLPINNGYTDYLFFYTNSGGTGYHQNLSTLEYNYYNTAFHEYVADYPPTVGCNNIIYARLDPISQVFANSTEYKHKVTFYYSVRRWVKNPPSTL
jgi:hypothetical protein